LIGGRRYVAGPVGHNGDAPHAVAVRQSDHRSRSCGTNRTCGDLRKFQVGLAEYRRGRFPIAFVLRADRLTAILFAANVPLGLIVIVRSRSHVPAAAAPTRGPLDVAGLALLAFGLLAVMIGLTRLDATAPALGGNALTLAAVAVALIAFAALIPVERAAREPVILPALFGTRQLVVTYTLEVLIGMLEGAPFFVPAALVAAQHLSYALAGIVASVRSSSSPSSRSPDGRLTSTAAGSS
jgi:hypothetical protein